MAGGTALVLMMKQGLIHPTVVIGLKDVAGLRGIRRLNDGGLEIPAMTTHREAERSPDVRAYCPALADAFAQVATVRIRNQATLGGNLAHADPAQDPPPMLLALDAQVVIAGPDGERTMPLDGFFRYYFETALAEAEVLTAVRLPPLPDGTRAAYVKFLPKTADDYATVSVAARLRLDGDGRCRDARVALGSCAGVPMRGYACEAALEDQQPSPGLLREAAALAAGSVDPLTDQRGSAEYKRAMASVWTERVLRRLLDGAV